MLGDDGLEEASILKMGVQIALSGTVTSTLRPTSVMGTIIHPGPHVR